MSHELLTPLHGILSFAKFGITKYKTAGQEKIYDYFESISQSGKTLMALIEDLLDLAKLDSGEMSFEFSRTDIATLISSVIGEFSLITAESGVTIKFMPQNLTTFGVLDSTRIQQVIRNLLSNAIKFSPANGEITLNAEVENEVLRIAVRDEGKGVLKNELEDIFNKFIQSSETKTDAGGTGLGLSICREIISAHNGRIWAENSTTNGAIFTFEIPISQS